MTHIFSFPYKEVLPTCHPSVLVDFVLLVDAEIQDSKPDEITILKAVAKTVLHDEVETDLTPVILPDESTFRGAQFLALLREAGRNHFHNLQKSLKV